MFQMYIIKENKLRFVNVKSRRRYEDLFVVSTTLSSETQAT